ncbi:MULTISPECIES: SCP2 sterol-binding domain-containing protein [unclassified Burkholderia]|uniref:SCP2 sterol-binding domain-containing protein n=1 Tax=unclassified Burkholderia TaxID=2613784 RepID=UPI000F57F669|nr:MULTISPECIES: SCP2 sterol-binding domain-containing protein [unclassified Burkholderia]RQS26488.1 sterol-binding protein [Burkholderia sp. Bp8995]RQS48466.1 sterol-binding protein [Burkholderia sp. Bp8989]
MTYLDEVTEKFKDAIANGPTPEKSLKIDLKNLGLVVVSRTGVSNEDADADTTITIGQKDFQDLVAGKLNPPVAFMQGKIKIKGDPSAALQWLPVIQRTSGV